MDTEKRSKTSLMYPGIGKNLWTEDVVPTVAFNYRKVRKGAVTLKIWDVAGQPKFRSMWERYCNGVDAVVFVVDSADQDNFHTVRFELHQLLSQPSLVGVPLLVVRIHCLLCPALFSLRAHSPCPWYTGGLPQLGNKNDLSGHATVKDLIREL
ncbi:P-loop containing nucleoside triphosphate hydrolase protein [Chiua virens]|nr:P-loop containing nucleoside triphosphate hydrolase protein [Chiua virens]